MLKNKFLFAIITKNAQCDRVVNEINTSYSFYEEIKQRKKVFGTTVVYWAL